MTPKCAYCLGQGTVEGITLLITCPQCGGTGYQSKPEAKCEANTCTRTTGTSKTCTGCRIEHSNNCFEPSNPCINRSKWQPKLRMKFPEAVNTACKEPSLEEALAWICIWENDRAINQVKRNEIWGTCFLTCIKEVLDKYHKPSPEEVQPISAGQDKFAVKRVWALSAADNREHPVEEPPEVKPSYDKCFYAGMTCPRPCPEDCPEWEYWENPEQLEEKIAKMLYEKHHPRIFWAWEALRANYAGSAEAILYDARAILSAIQAAGYVKLAENQEAPQYIEATDIDEFYNEEIKEPKAKKYFRLTTVQDILTPVLNPDGTYRVWVAVTVTKEQMEKLGK